MTAVCAARCQSVQLTLSGGVLAAWSDLLGSNCRAQHPRTRLLPTQLTGRPAHQPWPPPFPFLNLSAVLLSPSAAHGLVPGRGCYDRLS
jgi:hypothetical protein